ncbi:Conserved protein of unknown function [Mycobacterium canettii CIPT 140070017]|nr:Conserved protein of unknown function [Mycobacterium canettii CIPT 140070017]
MAVTTWLIDKSAYTRLAQSPDAQVWIDRIERGMVRISTITRLEVGYSFADRDGSTQRICLAAACPDAARIPHAGGGRSGS